MRLNESILLLMEELISALSNERLIEHTRTLAASERKITARIISCLEEIERRRLYADRGFTSLFAFCTEGLGYSAAAAQRRISAMRLIKDFKADQKFDIQNSLMNGALTLSHLSSVSRVMELKPELDPKELLDHVKKSTSKECDDRLAYYVGFTIPKPESIKRLSVNETRLSVSLDQDTVELLQHFKNLTAHKNPSGKIDEALKLALQIAIKAIDPIQKLTRSVGSDSEVSINERYVSPNLRKQVWKLYKGSCPYKDPVTNRICNSKYKLQIDHIRPVALGGKTILENLRLLCATHNQHEGRKIIRDGPISA